MNFCPAYISVFMLTVRVLSLPAVSPHLLAVEVVLLPADGVNVQVFRDGQGSGHLLAPHADQRHETLVLVVHYNLTRGLFREFIQSSRVQAH